MRASSFLDGRAIEIDSPAAALGGTSLEGALFVELRGDGLRLAGERLTTPQLLARLSEHAARNPRQRVIVKPSPGVALQDAVTLLDRIAASGLTDVRSEEHTSELQSLMRISYAVSCFKKKTKK